MERIVFDDGKWFDADEAESWNAGTFGGSFIYYEDYGEGPVPVEATNLWRSRLGQFVVQPADGLCTSVTKREAAKIMLSQGWDVPKELKDEVDELES